MKFRGQLKYNVVSSRDQENAVKVFFFQIKEFMQCVKGIDIIKAVQNRLFSTKR